VKAYIDFGDSVREIPVFRPCDGPFIEYLLGARRVPPLPRPCVFPDKALTRAQLVARLEAAQVLVSFPRLPLNLKN
jgi:hypothetical protein